ncbi:hypothetical protein PGT21_030689 [Puccinia graminis f. sp. tritici]|uniref:Hydrophobin n=2 Tax=Puccinia graminis f. sp. tritici TaxID=56615 RepID=E3KRK9_PUCGT|nr:uncharacterized protein PGTG_12675 [Puccinia graminis f. sp. tritici CRL 75-36-700-3]EFP86934.1 hypothetical protein PGTG_12675 [Puccinia graminis f. sp. tritici CRL 75-36-700-3]KAA1101818.1 hypothetical protein PGT21_030689 [Puccinia graminis f. sp. tritici]KAA1133956.1 hypothetical protein PGTUg99_033494 [Puccinia graminis f. sp. tritici]
MHVFQSTLPIIFLAGVCKFASARCGTGEVDACATYQQRIYQAPPGNFDCHITSSETHYCCPANQMVPSTPDYPLGYAVKTLKCYKNTY